MAGVLISFAGFSTPHDRGALSWHRAALAVREHAGAAVLPRNRPPATALAYWRVHAPNHRELARSVSLYPSISGAREHAAQVASAVEHVQTITFTVAATRGTGWYALLDGEPVLMCARWYESAAVAAHAAARSLAVLAVVAPSMSRRVSTEASP